MICKDILEAVVSSPQATVVCNILSQVEFIAGMFYCNP